MKWKFFVTLAFVLLFCASLCLPSFAATLPTGSGAREVYVTSSDLMSADRAVWLSSWNEVEDKYYNSQIPVLWDKITSTPDGSGFSGVKYTIDGSQYQYRNLTNIYDITKLTDISNKTEHDWYFGILVKIYYPASYSMNIFDTCSVYPVYSDIDGNHKGDTLHAITIKPEHISTVTVKGEEWYCVSYNFWRNPDYIGCSYSWIPDGYYLSGFGFNFAIGTGEYDNSNVDDWYIPSGTQVCFSEISGKSFVSSQALLELLEKFMGALSADIAEQTEELTNGWKGGGFSSDGSGLTDYEGAEKDLLNSQQSALDQSTSILNGVGGSLSKFQNGFIVVGNIFNQLIGVEWVDTLITVSLALGIVAFLLNITPSLVKRFANRSDKGEGG